MEQINRLNNLHSSITNTKKVYLKRQCNKKIPVDAPIAHAQKVYIYEQFFSNRNTTTLKKLYCNDKNGYDSKVQSLVKQYILDLNLTIWKYDEQIKDKDSFLEVTIDFFKKNIVYNRIKGKSCHLAKKKRNEYGSDKNTIIEQQHIITKMEQEKEQYTDVFNRWIEHCQVMMNVLTTYHKCIDSYDMNGMIELKKTLNSDFSIPGQSQSVSYIFGNLVKDTTQYKKRLKVSHEHHVQTQPVYTNTISQEHHVQTQHVYTNATVCTIAEKIAENLSLPQEVDEDRTLQAEEEEFATQQDHEEEENCRILAEEIEKNRRNVADNRTRIDEERPGIATEFARQQAGVEETTRSIGQRSEKNECSIIAVKSSRNAEAHELESQEQIEEDDCIIIEADDCIILEVESCRSKHAKKFESQDLPATLQSNIIASQQESNDPLRLARHLEFYNMCDQIKHIHCSMVELLKTESASLLYLFKKADEDQLQVPIPVNITKSRKKILDLVRTNYKKYFVDFTETQNEVNKQFSVKFDTNDSRNMYNTDAFFLFKDVYGDGNCAFYCLMESGLLNKAFENGLSNTEFETVLKKKKNYKKLEKKPTVLQFRYLLGEAFKFLYFTKECPIFRRMVHFFLVPGAGTIFGIDSQELCMRSTKSTTKDDVIRHCFTRIEDHGVFVDSNSFFSCAAYALNYLIMDEEKARFVIMNASPNRHVATPYDTESFENELMKSKYDITFDDYSEETSGTKYNSVSDIYTNLSNQKIKDYNCENTYHVFLHESGRPFEQSENLHHYLFMKRINHDDNMLFKQITFPTCTHS